MNERLEAHRKALILEAWNKRDPIEALRIASKFKADNDEMRIIHKGWHAHSQRAFVRQLGKDPNEIIAKAIRMLQARYGLCDIPRG